MSTYDFRSNAQLYTRITLHLNTQHLTNRSQMASFDNPLIKLYAKFPLSYSTMGMIIGKGG